ncbi:Type I secretion system ATPase [Candidatus Trichorickettsia mobilis]|uniref:Type I secretion system ATPase n=1 Tax=Candidatus Trichorickettsia mobilis TaxID=1346319 RepID=A0ABZ0USR0_9RICK|nr:ATP-binding cassette domain-containing protein [Candidatus Trichorickettsia mobilis]WPY00646.1 Type I secretion system ATPase [Candidatus Trichorickettsia mobilis]
MNKEDNVNKEVFFNIIIQLKQQYNLDNHTVEYIKKKLSAEDINLEELKLRLASLHFNIAEITNIKDVLAEENKSYLLYTAEDDNESKICNYNEILTIDNKNTLLFALTFHPQERVHAHVAALPEKITFNWFMRQLFSKNGIYIFIGGLITNILAFIVPLFDMNVFDKVLPNGFISNLMWLLLVAIVFLLIWFVNRAALTFLIGENIEELEEQVDEFFTNRLIHVKANSAPEVNSFLSQVISDGQSLTRFMGLLHIIAVIDVPFMLLFIFMIYFIGGDLVYVTIIAISIVVIINLFYQSTIKNFVHLSTEKTFEKKHIQTEIMQSINFIKLANMENYFCNKEIKADIGGSKRLHYNTIFACINHVSTLIMFGSLITVVSIGAVQVIEGTLTIGQLAACSMFTSRAVSTSKITGLLFNFYRLKMLFSNLEHFSKLPLEHTSSLPLERVDNITVKSVSISFNSREMVLDSLNVTLDRQSNSFIYGKPGSGKSTLFNALAGLQPIHQGSIEINSLELSNFGQSDIRSKIHFSPATARFFTGTILDNLKLDNQSVTHLDIADALNKVGLLEKVNKIEHGLAQEIINFEKVPFSSGESKKFMLSRIFLVNADFIIIDEPFDYLDDESGAQILKQIIDYTKQKNIGLCVFSNRKRFAPMFAQAFTINQGKLYPLLISDK